MPWEFTQFSQLPSAALLCLPKSHLWSENLFLFKGKKPEVTGHQIWVLGELSHLGDLMFCQKTLHDTWCWMGTLSWWSCQSPDAHGCSLLNHPNSFCGRMLKLSAKFDADLLLYLLSHFECNGHTVHMLTQQHLPPPLTSTVRSSLFTHVHSVHSLWLPGCINVVQTILIILTMAGLFLDRPCRSYHGLYWYIAEF